MIISLVINHGFLGNPDPPPAQFYRQEFIVLEQAIDRPLGTSQNLSDAPDMEEFTHYKIPMVLIPNAWAKSSIDLQVT